MLALIAPRDRLSNRLPSWATKQASVVGQGFGAAFGLLGAFLLVGAFWGKIPAAVAGNGGWILLVGVFLFFIARASRLQAGLRATLSRLRVRDVMVQHVVTLPPDLPVADAVNTYFLPHGHSAFPVVEDGRFVGMVTVVELQGLPQSLWPWRRVGDIMLPASPELTVEPGGSVLAAFEHMLQSGHSHLAVVEEGRLVGLLSRSGIARILQLKGRWESSAPPAA